VPVTNDYGKVRIAPDEEKANKSQLQSTPIKLSFKDVVFEVT